MYRKPCDTRDITFHWDIDPDRTEVVVIEDKNGCVQGWGLREVSTEEWLKRRKEREEKELKGAVIRGKIAEIMLKKR